MNSTLLTAESRPSAMPARDLADELRTSLRASPRRIPSWALYDHLGSALFDAICHLPWYSVTRAELALLEAHGREIGCLLPQPLRFVELGPGSGRKAATLARGLGVRSLDAHLVDVSSSALRIASSTLTAVPGVRVTAHQATYEIGLAEIRRAERGERAAATLVAFLGSNIGNFDPEEADALLRRIRRTLAPGDWLLLGADLVKPAGQLLLAYDDPLGVTAAFNKNLLLRINREMDADFDLARFDHLATWQPVPSRVEMHLVSRHRQVVQLRALDFDITLAAGERIWTESSYKYEPETVLRMGASPGFLARAQWIDQVDGFALTLFESV